MNVVKCANGHFFDGDTYPTCPHCGAQVGSGESLASANGNKSSKSGLFGKFKEKSKTIQQVEQGFNHIPDVQEIKAPASGTSITGVMTEEDQFQTSPSDESKKNPTLDFWQASAKEDKNDNNSQEEILTDDTLQPHDDLNGQTSGLFSDVESSEDILKKVILLTHR